MKLKDNALDIARGLAVTMEEKYNMPDRYWVDLMEYEDQDWITLEFLLKKYAPRRVCTLKKENLDQTTKKIFFCPSSFLYDLKQHLGYRKQSAVREAIEKDVDSSFASLVKCDEIMEKVFIPIIKLNQLKAELNSLATEVDDRCFKVEKVIEEMKNDDSLQSVIN